MKFLIFGTGDYYERYKKWFPSKDVLALLDNSEKKQNTQIDGIPVLAPEEGVKLPYDPELLCKRNAAAALPAWSTGRENLPFLRFTWSYLPGG